MTGIDNVGGSDGNAPRGPETHASLPLAPGSRVQAGRDQRRTNSYPTYFTTLDSPGRDLGLMAGMPAAPGTDRSGTGHSQEQTVRGQAMPATTLSTTRSSIAGRSAARRHHVHPAPHATSRRGYQPLAGGRAQRTPPEVNRPSRSSTPEGSQTDRDHPCMHDITALVARPARSTTLTGHASCVPSIQPDANRADGFDRTTHAAGA